MFSLFATAPKGLASLLVDELTQLGAKDAKEKLAGVEFTGDLALAYRACLWSRLANRILLRLGSAAAATADELYAAVKTIPWHLHLDPKKTLSVHLVSSQSAITHTLFGAQKVKDAIVDQMRERFGERPDVSRQQPDVSVYVYLHHDVAHIYLDLSGESLHKRGYRLEAGAAPLKENLAAGILLRATWPAIAKQGGSLLDPMCGSGTLLIEAAMMAADKAPGLLRDYFGFLGWKQHQPSIWQSLLKEASERAQHGMQHLPRMTGYDNDPTAIKIAFDNIERAGFHGHMHVEKRELALFAPHLKDQRGLVVTNPPYGERLGEVNALAPLYTLLGERLKTQFEDWQAAVFTGNPDLGKQMGLRAERYYSLMNGALPCKLLLFSVQAAYYVDRSATAENERRIRAAQKAVAGQDSQHIAMFVNRLRKNLRHRRKAAERQRLTTYRVYDADIPEYAFAIDITPEGAEVREYEAPRFLNPKVALRHQQEVLSVLPDVLNLSPKQISFITQSLQKGK